ncbi:rudimentary-like [Carabus blaptoides fortunei]
MMDTLADLLIEHLGSVKDYKLLCGVPYTALPIATVMSVKTGVSMVMRRKEAKDYGTRKMIEGKFAEGDSCLIVEDVVTSGGSILETVNDLKNVGLSATDAIVVLNRQQGGENILKINGVTMHSLLTISQLLEYLFEAKCIDQTIVDKVKNYLTDTQIENNTIKIPKYNRLKMAFSARAEYSKNAIGKKLFQIMSDKKTNLCIAADLTSSTKLLTLAEQIGSHICILKTHIDMIEDYSKTFVEKLRNIAKAHNFLIMEDRKFADIGKTVSWQFSKGVYNISSWADLITAHALPGKGLIQAINESEGKERGIFLLAEMSSTGNLCTESYSASSIKLAQEYPESVAGIVCQSPKFVEIPHLIQLTPGIQLDNVGDNLGQQYNSPEHAVMDKGADIGVVGRGITQSENPIAAAENYKNLLWAAYLKRIEN